MSRKRRNFSASFKAKVALAAARGDQTTAQLAARFAVHSSQVTAWKKQLLENVTELFVDGRRLKFYHILFVLQRRNRRALLAVWSILAITLASLGGDRWRGFDDHQVGPRPERIHGLSLFYGLCRNAKR